MPLPDNLQSLHSQEEQLRGKALELVRQDQNLRLHVAVIEQAMNLGDLLRQCPTDDEDMKVIQILGMRMFNAFGASLKLALSGYAQNSALLMRDVLETVFLVDLFRGDRDLIKKWRFADGKTLKADFSPAAVRKALDARYGHTSRRREETYKLFSELAGHPTIKSAWMMRPQKDGDAVIGPFIEKTSLEIVLSEMGRLAVQAGQHLVAFFPGDWQQGFGQRLGFAEAARKWLVTFYPEADSA
ncbi:MAG: hypothetical protein GEU76_03960 [Alphaproteobacteria bacterium]|nr:hypothetical protein [Alphaproteobacteria bacterium]